MTKLIEIQNGRANDDVSVTFVFVLNTFSIWFSSLLYRQLIIFYPLDQPQAWFGNAFIITSILVDVQLQCVDTLIDLSEVNDLNL